MKITMTPEYFGRDGFSISEKIEYIQVGDVRYEDRVHFIRVSLRDQTVRECLIASGWTPPLDEEFD